MSVLIENHEPNPIEQVEIVFRKLECHVLHISKFRLQTSVSTNCTKYFVVTHWDEDSDCIMASCAYFNLYFDSGRVGLMYYFANLLNKGVLTGRFVVDEAACMIVYSRTIPLKDVITSVGEHFCEELVSMLQEVDNLYPVFVAVFCEGKMPDEALREYVTTEFGYA